jgi:hypothetical protein
VLFRCRIETTCNNNSHQILRRYDNTIEWAHFVQRDNGLREKVFHGEVKNPGELDTVLEIMNNNLLKVFGMVMQAADYEISTLDGKKPPTAIH